MVDGEMMMMDMDLMVVVVDVVMVGWYFGSVICMACYSWSSW